MALDVISEIEEAENAAAKIRSDAKAEAAAIVSKAEADGKALIEAAKQKAAEESAVALREKLAEATAKESEIIAQTKKETELLEFMAKGRMETAAGFIKERIVKG